MPITGSATPAANTTARTRGARATNACRVAGDPRTRKPAGDGERRQHEHEMPDAVVHRRPRHHRDRDRQHGGKREGEQHRAGARHERAAARGDERAGYARTGEQRENLRQLQPHQHRHIAARHVGRRDPFAAVELVPRLLEEMREHLDGAKRIERMRDAPGPDQPHHRIGEHRRRDQREQKPAERDERRARPAVPALDQHEEADRQDGDDHAEARHDARADGKAEAQIRQYRASRPRASDIPRAGARGRAETPPWQPRTARPSG